MIAYPMAGISLDVSHDATATRNSWGLHGARRKKNVRRLENSANFTPNLLWPIGSSFLHQKTPFWVLCILYIYICIHTIYMYMYYINIYIYTYSQLEELQSSNLRNRSWDPWHPHSGVGFEAGTWRDDPPTMALCREIGRSRHRPNNGMFDVKTLADYMVVEILCILSIYHSKYHSIAI